MKKNNPVLIPTILCGGAGSRLWPLSREQYPKPFIKLDDGASLLQKAFLRASGLANVSEILTVTNRDFFFMIEDEYKIVNKKKLSCSYILEPFARNTAPAIAAAACYIKEKYDKDAQLLILTADHLIEKYEAFKEAVNEAVELASQGRLVTFGIKPSSPETGYGYIECSGNKVIKFHEKPSFEKAVEYLNSDNYFWNSGMFCFSADTILSEMKKYCPEISENIHNCMSLSRKIEGEKNTQFKLEPDSFGKVFNVSIDYAVMEKTKNAAIVPCDINWSDIGCWRALGDLTPADKNSNRAQGDVILHNTTNCTIKSHNRIVGVVGLQDTIIIDTPDALLVADKESAQDVKHIYSKLKDDGHETHKLHRTVSRPWGTYTILEDGEFFKVKRIEVKSKASLSLQMHHHRSEHWVVVSGSAKVINGEHELLLGVNESTFIPAGNKHCLENLGPEILVLIEVQTGSYLGEDDIVRYQDIYGRVT